MAATYVSTLNFPTHAVSPQKLTVNGHFSNHTADRLQIVNDEKQFTSDLSDQISSWGLRDVGFDYNLVAVFGSQSTGKSTLLNRLFGTNFDVMDESKRQQTTKGIWMCRGHDMNVLVMDVEGTDGRERGEDQDFERKSALFSLASSEVLIVNLWEHQVGLYQGANMGLLKTVFEVNLGLFGKKSQEGSNQRTLLLFRPRSQTSRQHWTADLHRIWDTLSKPAELQDRKLTDYFDLSFTALPHKILASDRFESDVRRLRGRFTDKSRDDFTVVAFYMEGIWEQVQTNKDLDLPTQQELLAQFRCDEISSTHWQTRYDREALRYHQGMYKQKHANLVGTFDSPLSPLFLGQLKYLHKAVLVSFKAATVAGHKVEARFSDGAKEAIVTEGDASWQWEEELRMLRDEIQSVADQLRKDETKKMANTIERNFKKQIAEPVDSQLSRPTPEIWDSVLRTYKDTLENTEDSYPNKARSFGCTDKDNDQAVATLRQCAWATLRAKIDEQTGDAAILTKLCTYFEERFRYDEQGVPRIWKPDDDIDGVFTKVKDVTLELISLYAKIVPQDSELAYTPPEDGEDDAAGLVMFSETKALELGAWFRREADARYIEAKQSTVVGIAQIPYWIYSMLVVLGWNEAMLILFNPLYFALLNLAGPLFSSISR
ncbi:RHD3/Sey1 [Russula vinacea]|nr:RHD3/Sey1 [Russula vinacea]